MDNRNNNLQYSKLKVIEEASEVINELVDSMVKSNDNYKSIIEEMAHLKLRMDLLAEEYQKHDAHFAKKIKQVL